MGSLRTRTTLWDNTYAESVRISFYSPSMIVGCDGSPTADPFVATWRDWRLTGGKAADRKRAHLHGADPKAPQRRVGETQTQISLYQKITPRPR